MSENAEIDVGEVPLSDVASLMEKYPKGTGVFFDVPEVGDDLDKAIEVLTILTRSVTHDPSSTE